jgi:hypothetical protein
MIACLVSNGALNRDELYAMQKLDFESVEWCMRYLRIIETSKQYRNATKRIEGTFGPLISLTGYVDRGGLQQGVCMRKDCGEQSRASRHSTLFGADKTYGDFEYVA